MPEPTVEFRKLTKRYGAVIGIENIEFTIGAGEVFGFLGPNGAGKTTAMRSLMGLITPTSGEVRVFGERVVPGQATAHARIGYLPGEFRVWRGFPGRRSLSTLAALGARDGTAERRQNLAERLEADLDRPAGNLSKGNRQKLAVLSAFQHNPDLLVLDEPTSGLDPLVRRVVLDLVREFAEAGATVLLSSHDLSEVSAVCGRAAILREGHLIEVAPIHQIVQQGEYRLQAWFSEPDLQPVFPSSQLPGARLIEQRPGMMELACQGSADAVLKWLAQFSVERLAMPQTSLEESFLDYYRPSGAAVQTQPGSAPLETTGPA